jgi:hypothetical protein
MLILSAEDHRYKNTRENMSGDLYVRACDRKVTSYVASNGIFKITFRQQHSTDSRLNLPHVAVPLTHNLPRNEAQKIIKYENLVLEIKNIWKLYNVSIYPLVSSAEGVVIRHFLKYLVNVGLTKNTLRVAQNAVLLTMCHIAREFLQHAP